MAELKLDLEFVREPWEVPGHLSDYVDAVSKVGLWDSGRLLVSKYFRKEDRILDIGCGAGRTTIALYRLGYLNVQGMDLSKGMIERATCKTGCRVRTTSLNRGATRISTSAIIASTTGAPRMPTQGS